MDLEKMVPLVIYDDECYLCIKFAKFVNFLARDKLLLVGHHSNIGQKLRSEILDSSALEMFWFVDGKTAYGGRAALLPLFKTILTSKDGNNKNFKIEDTCNKECKTAKAVFARSASLLSHSKKISLSR
jgi:hypothetical protein